jgi:hypothetical protein
MAPYFGLADRTDDGEVLAALDWMVVPADPVSRRFYRGLLVLLGVLSAPALSLRPVDPGRCLMLVGQVVKPAAGDAKPSVPGSSSLIRSPIEVRDIPGPHARMFEQPALLQAVAEFLA